MNVAFISYEYPPDTADGGIATYVQQAAAMLGARGHHVEVFAASRHRKGSCVEDGIAVHRVEVRDPEAFAGCIAGVFARRHAAVGFTVLEGPDFGADARDAVRLVPTIPLVIKLHTPRFLVDAISQGEMGFAARCRAHARAIRRGDRPRGRYDPSRDRERRHASEADEVVAPSNAIAEKVAAVWHLDRTRLSHVPYPYVPSRELLDIPVGARTRTVSFLGRLEVRKGVIDLARAIPRILERHPRARFRFIGKAEDSPERGMDMRQFLERILGRHGSAVEFAGPVPLARIPSLLATTDICVFPSTWENFPLVCLEAMAAGRAIVGSSAGGMTELLDAGSAGRLVPPRSPDRIARAVIELLDQPDICALLGQAARARVLAEYNADRIGALQEASYGRAVERKRSRAHPAMIPGTRSLT